MSQLVRHVRVGLVAVLVCNGVPLTATSATVSPSADRELACGTYTTDTFIDDKEFHDKHFAVPCVESVSGDVPTTLNTAATGSGSLHDVFDATKTPLERFQNGFDAYSWLTFVALNQPAAGSSKAFGASDGTTVWESRFVPLEEVMHFRDDPKIENFSLHHLPAECAHLSTDGAAPTLFVTVDDVAYDQPFKSGPLVDQQGHYSLNTIFVNVTMRDYVRHPSKDHLADGEEPTRLDTFVGQQAFYSTIDFPVGKPSPPRRTEFPGVVGAMMIKASWRQLPDTRDPTIHTVRAYVYRPAEVAAKAACAITPLGLVGFHVVHKTTNRHQWVWTTFEHVRNVPTFDDVKAGTLEKAYFFYNPQLPLPEGCTPETITTTACQKHRLNKTPPQPWGAVAPPEERSQIVRAQAITHDTQTINKAAHTSLGAANVWANYQLISTQWPADFECASETGVLKGKALIQTNELRDLTCAPAPPFLPNSTLESYIQHDIGTAGGAPQATSSCIACHNNAVAYQKFNYGDGLSLDQRSAGGICHVDDKARDLACNTGSDFTFIFEQVCSPIADPNDPHKTLCKHDLVQ